MRPFTLKYICLFILLVLCVQTYAQREKLNFKHYNINDGLSQNTIYSMLQDKDGFMWFGTEDGLNKFDGYSFITYKHENNNPKSISDNQINALMEEKNGKIWIGTALGLNTFNKKTESFTHLPTSKSKGESSEHITSIFKDRKGNIWIGGFEGLKLFNPATKDFKLFRINQDSSSYSANRIHHISEGPDHLLWISGPKSFTRFDPIKKQFVALPPLLRNHQNLNNATVRFTMTDHEKLWIATENEGLFVYTPKQNTLIHYQHNPKDEKSLGSNIVRTIHSPTAHEVWIGTRDGLSIFSKKTLSFKNYKSDKYNTKSLSHNSVRAILKDKAGNIWLGTYSGGINLYAEDKGFAYIGEQIGSFPGLSFKTIGALVNGDHHSFWAGTEGAGLNYIRKDLSVFKTYSLPDHHINLFYNTVKSLYKDGSLLWIGTYKGLVLLNTTTMEFKTQPIKSSRGVNTINKTGKGIWLGTNGEGLINIQHNGQQKTFKHQAGNPKSLSRNNVITLLKDDKDHLWVETEDGLNYFDNHTFTSYFHNAHYKYSLSSSNILSLYKDTHKRLWIGTKGGGVNIFDGHTKRFYAITEKMGLANNVIHAIAEDAIGNIWLSSNKGLSRITLKNGKLPIDTNHILIKNYTVEDGLQSNQFTTNASFKDEKGILYFGGISGLNYFDPSKIKVNNFEPEVVLTDFQIRNQPANFKDEISPLKLAINEATSVILNYDQAFITLKFASLNFSNPGKNQYAYKMENLYNDGDWHFVGSQRTATFTNLSAGEYIFRVKASNSDGVWGNKVKSLKIIVLPPWWKTWWAYTIYASIIGLLLYYFYYYSYRTAQLKSQLSFEYLNHLKDQEHAQKTMNAYTNISHEIKTPLTLVLSPLEKLISTYKDNEQLLHSLQLMQRNGTKLLKSVNQLLDFRKFETNNMHLQATFNNIVPFTEHVVSDFNAYAKDKNINLELKSPHQEINIWFDSDKMEKVLNNLLSNALKFTPDGGHIYIEITVGNIDEQEMVQIKVIDNGLGIPQERIDTVFNQFIYYNENNTNVHGSGIGLAYCKGLVALHYGNLKVESKHIEGSENYTCFTIELPLGNSHLKTHEMFAEDPAQATVLSALNTHEDPEQPKSEILEKKKQLLLTDLKGEQMIILIVEDNKDIQQFLVSHFETDFKMMTADNGIDGLQKAIEIIPDLIISDIMMPEMTGTALCAQLKSDNRTSHIPIILLTAKTPVEAQIEGLETGADDYVMKPFNMRMLEARVWNLLETRKKLRELYKQDITLQPTNLAIASPDVKFLEKVMAYIDENLAEPTLNVEDLGKTMGMSKVSFYRKIKALTNQTTIEFIRNMRLSRSEQLLVQGNFNINQIAYMVGFTDVDYFRKCFKEKFGHTPKEYQNQNK